MAEAAAPKKKADWIDITGWLILLGFIFVVVQRILAWINRFLGGRNFYDAAQTEVGNFSVFNMFPGFTIFSWVVSFILLFVCIYLLIRINSVMQELKARQDPPATEDIKLREPAELKTKQNERWTEIQNLLRSNSESAWRLGILEADILLGEMLDVLGYEGEDIGERLKNATRNEFTTLDKAWEAHKIRNKVAHEGSQFTLTREEANRIVGLFEDVFKEFSFI